MTFECADWAGPTTCWVFLDSGSKKSTFNSRHGDCDISGQTYRNGTLPMFSMFASLLFYGLVAAAGPVQLVPVSYTAPDRTAVESIHAGNRDCPHCMLAGANLDNTCVKGGNLEGADFSNVHAVLMCMSYADFKGVSFRGANLAGANLAHANVDDADFTDADLSITSVKGTDLTKAKGLTQAQLDKSCGDAETKTPAGLKTHMCT
jgi:uncharacterized protein YjbI with pentapeptide repeats